MNTEQLQELINKHSKPELSKVNGMVYQVWEDGEITLQKSGELLNQRSLHCIEAGHDTVEIDINLFHTRTSNGHGFIFTDREGAEAIREAIFALEK